MNKNEKCPYCDREQGINHDDGYDHMEGKLEETNYEDMKKIVVTIKAVRPCYLTRFWNGDPPRTLDISKARKFSSIKAAKRAIELAKLTHPFQEREYGIELVNT